MKLKKESVTTLLLVLLWQAVVCSSNVAAPKSSRLEDVLKDDGEKDLFRNLKGTTKKTVKDLYSPEEISRLKTSFAERVATVNENQANACSLGWEVFYQVYKLSSSEWMVDDRAVALLHGDLQSLIECTRPRDRVVFSNTRIIRLPRTLEIVHELEFVGIPLSTDKFNKANKMLPSLTCPYSKPALLIRGTRFAASTLNIKDCMSSTSSSNASIVLEYGSSAVLNHLVLEDNKNRAIYVKNRANLVLVESDLENNRVSSNGGAIYVEDYSNVVIQKSSFKRNYGASGDGGAIYLDDYNVIVISDSAFTDNTCNDDAGAIYLDGGNTLRIQGSVFKSNASPDDGGAIYLLSGNKVDVTDSVFTNNTSGYWGGSICVSGSSSVSIVRSAFTDNISRRAGGAVRLSSRTELSITGSSFTNNTSAYTGGGALSLDGHNALNIQESLFTNNTSKYAVGGAIRVDGYNAVNIRASSFADNTCGSYGGVIYLNYWNTLIVQGSMLSNNVAKINGGGIYSKVNNTMTAYKSSLTHNTAINNGGALQLLDNNHATIIGCTLASNKATNGSASNLGEYNTFTIERSVVSGNTCTRYGSVLYLGSRNVVAGFDSFITNNHAGQTSGQYNGAIYSADSSSSVMFMNSIILGMKKTKNAAADRQSYPKDSSLYSRRGITV